MRNGLTLDQAFDEGLKEMEWNGRKKWIDLFIEKILDVGSSLIFDLLETVDFILVLVAN